MNFRNKTKNQHYISHTEQSLNAVDPLAVRSKRTIHMFTILERDPPVLSAPTSERIEDTLSGHDLFTFDVIDRRYRDNLEEQFQKYEQRVADHSRALLQKLGAGSLDIKEELVEVFAAKFLNMNRNPFSIDKMLNTVGEAERFIPADATLQALLEKVATGSRPHQTAVCADYGLTSQTYERWLRALFVLLAPRSGLNIFEDTVAGLFNNHHVTVQVNEYRDTDPCNVCLLSDRGVAFVSSKADEAIIAFNINSKAFAIYGFTDPEKRAPHLPPGATDSLRGKLVLRHKIDDLDDLASFNQRTIVYGKESVFAASPSPRLAR